jgi:sulfur relay (sulfurtransferase) complex TusBCD TusD component (DsrE family)
VPIIADRLRRTKALSAIARTRGLPRSDQGCVAQAAERGATVSNYVLIQSKSPWESGDVGQFYSLARELGQAGGTVTFFLVQNGVMSARTGAKDAAFDQLLQGKKVRVLADDFSLRERAIDSAALKAGIAPSPIDEVVELISGGAKALWH